MMFSMKRTVPRSCLAPSIMTPSACFVPYSGAPLLTRLPSAILPSCLRNSLPRACASRKSNSAGRKRRFVVASATERFMRLTRHLSKLREIELRVQREIHEKRQELLAKEESLRCGSASGFGDTVTNDADA
jgi:hypothetical protein